MNPGDIVTARKPGGRLNLQVRVLYVSAVPGNRFVLGRRIRRNDDGTTSTYGGDHLYYVPPTSEKDS
jgi:hypothetical protein